MSMYAENLLFSPNDPNLQEYFDALAEFTKSIISKVKSVKSALAGKDDLDADFWTPEYAAQGRIGRLHQPKVNPNILIKHGKK